MSIHSGDTPENPEQPTPAACDDEDIIPAEIFDLFTKICPYTNQYDINGLKHGVWITYYRDNSKRLVETFKHGVLHGKTEYWAQSGSLDSIIEYKNNVRDGDMISRDMKSMITRTRYVDGEIHGCCESWDSDGRIVWRYHYENTKKHGVCKKWDEDGNLVENQTYVRGVLQEPAAADATTMDLQE